MSTDRRQPTVPADVVQAPAAAAFSPPATTGVPIGGIVWYIGATDLGNLEGGRFLVCSGQQVAVASYPVLAARIGSQWNAAFGAPSAGNVRLPNLKGRMLIAPDGGVSFIQGAIGGEKDHTLTVPETPVHDHGPLAGGSFVTTNGGISAQINAPGFAGYSIESRTGGAGGGQPHNNMPPYIVVAAYVRAL